MTGELTIFKQGGNMPSTAFQGVHLPTQRLDDGVSAGFAKVSYKGSKWGIKYQGQYHPIQARMPDNTIIQSPFLDVVILRAAAHPSKAWYEGVYAEGDSAPPDCWSTNGFKPDTGVPKRQCETCIGCQWNVWGSKVNRDTGEATRGKACMDSKRVVVVPVGDIENKYYGGPMMLSVPPTSLKRLGPYQNGLEANGFHYAQVWTRITFEPQSAYPLFVFDALSALNDVQAAQVVKMLQHPLIERILNADMQATEAWDDPSLNTTAPRGTTPQVQPTMVTPGAQATPSGNQVAPGNNTDGMDIPAALRRTPAGPQPSAPPPSGPAPGTQPVQQAASAPPPQEAQQEVLPPEPAPAVTLPPGMQLPPGMTPEMAAAFLAQFTQPQQAAKGNGRGRKAAQQRTPPVQPTNMDSSQPQGQMTIPGTNPQQAQPTMVVPSGPAPNGGAAPDQAVGQIMSTVKSLL